MGTSSSAYKFNLSQYQYLNEIVDPRFGVTKVYRKNETGELICIIEKILNQPCEPFLKLEHQNLLKIHYYQAQMHKEVCSIFTKLYIIYEYVSNDLKTIINNRIKKKQYFAEEQLWSLLAQCLSALIYLKSYNYYPMDMRNIFISNQGTIKFNSIFDNHMSSYMQLVNHITEEVHIAPEELDQLQNRQLFILDKEKCEIFQLGLTALWAASLEDTDSLFNKAEWRLNENNLLQRIQNIGYSNILKQLMTKMLSVSPQSRGNFQDISNLLLQQQQEENLTKIIIDKKMLCQSEIQQNRSQVEVNNQDCDEYQYQSQLSHTSNRKVSRQLNFDRLDYNSNKISSLQRQISMIGSITLKDETAEINKTNYQFKNNNREQQHEMQQIQSQSMLQIETMNCSPISSARKTPPVSSSKNQLNSTSKPIITQKFKSSQQPVSDTSWMSQQSFFSNNKSQRNMLETKIEDAIMKSKIALVKFDAAVRLNNYYKH